MLQHHVVATTFGRRNNQRKETGLLTQELDQYRFGDGTAPNAPHDSVDLYTLAVQMLNASKR